MSPREWLFVAGHVARHAFKTPRRIKDRARQIRRRSPGEVLQRFMNMLACSGASALLQCPACGLYRFLERFRAARHDRAIDKLPADPLPDKEIVQGFGNSAAFYSFSKTFSSSCSRKYRQTASRMW